LGEGVGMAVPWSKSMRVPVLKGSAPSPIRAVLMLPTDMEEPRET